jgi:ATP-dependent DNA ligase
LAKLKWRKNSPSGHLRARGHDASAYAYAFDLLAIDDRDVRSEPLEQHKAALAKLLRKAKPGIRLSEHLTGRVTPSSSMPASWA